ncbi:MAG: GntR family transcriptional regulator [Actinobacteria bacterium]|nr:GntR family transcriptional regulator [Actinomycetota bacterium]
MDLSSALGEAARSVAVQTRAEHTAEAVRDAIFSGRIERGSQVGESQISSAFGVSRNTAREAVRLLAAEGLVSQRPNHSPIVTVLAGADVRDVFAVRTVIELGAVEMIVRLGAAADLAPLRRAVDGLGRLVEFEHQTEVIEADLAFHSALVAAADSPRLATAFGRIESEVRLCLSISTRSHGTVEELVDQHAQLLRLAEEGRFDEFRQVLEADMEEAVRLVIDGLGASGDVAS